jgi:hypothetical protein
LHHAGACAAPRGPFDDLEDEDDDS